MERNHNQSRIMEEFSPEMLILYQKFDLENDLAAEENFYKISIFTS